MMTRNNDKALAGLRNNYKSKISVILGPTREFGLIEFVRNDRDMNRPPSQ